jgi:hypothetical protein
MQAVSSEWLNTSLPKIVQNYTKEMLYIFDRKYDAFMQYY